MDYQKAFGVSKPTASRDLEDMLRKGILEKIGTTGKGTYYVLNRKGLTKGSKGSSPGTRAMAHKWFIWLIGIRDSIPPAPSPSSLINSRRSYGSETTVAHPPAHH